MKNIMFWAKIRPTFYGGKLYKIRGYHTKDFLFIYLFFRMKAKEFLNLLLELSLSALGL